MSETVRIETRGGGVQRAVAREERTVSRQMGAAVVEDSQAQPVTEIDFEYKQEHRRRLFEFFALLEQGDDELAYELLEMTELIIRNRRFRFADYLGEGSFGIVMLVEDIEDSGVRYAVKLSEPFDRRDLKVQDDEEDDEVRHRAHEVRSYVREIAAQKSLTQGQERPPFPKYHHAHIIPDPVNTRGGPDMRIAALVMEYVEGDNLETIIQEADGLCDYPDVMIQLSLQIAEGVAYAHEKGIVHSDLKPEQIILTEGDVPIICDLGTASYTPESSISRRASFRRDMEGVTVRTRKFYPMTNWEAPSRERDVFALGRTIQQMLFSDDFESALEMARRARQMRNHYMMQLFHLSGRMTQEDPNDRPTMDQVLHELRNLERMESGQGLDLSAAAEIA